MRRVAAVVLAAACAPPARAPAVVGCPAASVAVLGACLQAEEARDYCGKAARPEKGGCAAVTCGDVEEVDLSSGDCRATSAAGTRHAAPGDGGLPVCRGDAVPFYDGQELACVPRAASCGRGARWAGGACEPEVACPRGAADDGAGRCESFVRRDGAETVLDIGAWIRLVIGPDGGRGRPAICGPIAQRPRVAGVPAHGKAVVGVQVDIVFPDNIVSDARVAVHGSRDPDEHDLNPLSEVPLEDLLAPVWVALRASGGISSAASAKVQVRCTMDGGEPLSTARTDGQDGPAGGDASKPRS